MKRALTCLELCAGGGGQALGLEMAGIDHAALVELDKHACATLRLNRPQWDVRQDDLRSFDASSFRGVDLVAAGLPCPPFSVAGKQLGASDDRNLFPAALRIIAECQPRAILIENVRGFLDAVFDDYRRNLVKQLRQMGYACDWRLLNASDFGVPQLRPRVAIVALRADNFESFSWPLSFKLPLTVGQTLYDLMASRGWKGARLWKEQAGEIAPTIVGGSHKHGGPDLGPTRARKAWASLSVDGLGIANEAPAVDFLGMPRLTLRMVARLQGFPDSWQFSGSKTTAYRQVGNAFPPPVAAALASAIQNALQQSGRCAVAG
jgi:DNA (cytosine-5)-methyltransferase 1